MKLITIHLFWLSFLLFTTSGSYAVELKKTNQYFRNDYLVFTVPNSFNTIEPAAMSSAQTKLLLPLIYETLVKVDDTQQIVPALAKSWHIDLSKRLIEFKIDENHRFSNGMHLTADDVIFSFNSLCSKGGRVAKELIGLDGCAKDKSILPSIKKIGNYTIQLKFSGNPSIFLHQLASPASGIVKLADGKLYGSGPYAIEKQSHNGEYLVLSLNKYFHNSKQIANKGLIIRKLDEKSFAKGLSVTKPDGSLMYRSSSVKKISDPDYKIVDDVAFITQALVLNNQKFPFDQEIVRKALLAELYNSGHLESCVDGGTKAYGFIPYGLGGSIANKLIPKMKAITPEEVFRHVPELKENLIEVNIHQHIGRKNLCEKQRLINAAAKFHIKVQLIYHSDYKTLLPLYFNHELDGFVELFVFTNREAYTALLYFDPSDDSNFANIHNSDITLHLNDALNNFSTRKRFSAYQQIVTDLNLHAHVIPYYYVGSSALISNCLEGVLKEFYFNPFEHLKSVYRKKGCLLKAET